MTSRTSTEAIPLTPIVYPASAVTSAAPSQISVALPGGPAFNRVSDDHQSLAPAVVRAGEAQEDLEVSKSRTFLVITSVTCITGISSLLAGLVAVGLPTIAKDLELGANLLLW